MKSPDIPSPKHLHAHNQNIWFHEAVFSFPLLQASVLTQGTFMLQPQFYELVYRVSLLLDILPLNFFFPWAFFCRLSPYILIVIFSRISQKRYRNVFFIFYLSYNRKRKTAWEPGSAPTTLLDHSLEIEITLWAPLLYPLTSFLFICSFHQILFEHQPCAWHCAC